MITSEYLEQVVDFDQPILVVGPGADFHTDLSYDLCAPPMDRAIIWFAEKLAGRKGRLDIFEQDNKAPEGGSHCWFKVKWYLQLLAAKAPLGEIRFVIGDITKTILKEKEYGLVWDHGTLECWLGLIDGNSYTPQDRAIENYRRAIKEGGTVAICGHSNVFDNHPSPPKTRRIDLEQDAYRTQLNQEQIGLGRKRMYFLENDLLTPRHSCTSIFEISK